MIIEKEKIIKNIANKLAHIESYIKCLNKINLYDIDIIAEDFYAGLLNLVYGYNLKNLNYDEKNSDSIDLGDFQKRIAIQVTAVNSRSKVNDTIGKFIKYKRYEKFNSLKMLFITGKKIYSKDFDTQGYFDFDKSKDSLDIRDIVEYINHLCDEKKLEIQNYILEKLGEAEYKKEISKIDKLKYDLNEYYIERKIRFIDEKKPFLFELNDSSSYLTTFETFYNNRLLVVSSSAGYGKTLEAKNLANSINSKCENLYAFYYRLNTYTGQPIDRLIPEDYLLLESKNLVFILDGLDEIESKNINTFKNNIEHYCKAKNEVNIVIFTRMNFYQNQTDFFESELEGFSEYTLIEFNEDDLMRLALKYNVNYNDFSQEVNMKELYSYLTIPFYADNLLRYYKINKSLPEKEKIVEQLIMDAYKIDINKYKGKENLKAQKIKITKMLRQIGYILECLGKNYLTSDEYYEIPMSIEVRELIELDSIWSKDENNNWSFIHNNFGEFLAAQHLSNMSIDKIIERISYGENRKYFNMTWLNTLSFLAKLYDSEDLLKWIAENTPEYIGYFEVDRLDKETRIRLFNAIIDNYERHQTWITNEALKAISALSIENKIIDINYLAQKLNPSPSFIIQSNVLKVILNLENIYQYREELKTKLYELLLSDKIRNEEKYIILNIISKLKCLSKEELHKIIDFNKDNEDSNLRAGYYLYIFENDLLSENLDLILNNINVTLSRDTSDKPLFYDERKYYNQIFENITDFGMFVQIVDYIEKELSNHRMIEHIMEKICKNNFYGFPINEKLKECVYKLYKIASDNYFTKSIEYITNVIYKIKLDLELLDIALIDFFNNNLYNIDLFFNENCVNKIIEEYSLNKYTNEQMNMLISASVDIYKNKFIIAYNKKNKVKYKETKRIDYNKLRDQSFDRYINSIFNKDLFIEYVKEFMDYCDLKEISTEALNNIPYEKTTRWKYIHMKRFLHNISDDHSSFGTDIFDKWDWDMFVFNEIHKLLIDKEDYELEGSKKNIIINLFNNYINSCNFTKADTYTNDNSWSINNLANLVFCYYRRFNLSVDDSKKLDMTEFSRVYGCDYISIDEITEGLPKVQISRRIIENLKSKSLYGNNLIEHFNFCIKEKIKDEAIDTSYYFLNKERSKEVRLKSIEYEIWRSGLKHFINKFKNLIEEVLFLDVLNGCKIEQIIPVKQYMKEELKYPNSQELTLELAKYLILMNDIEGLIFYRNWLKENNRIYPDQLRGKSINEAISQITNPDAIDILCEIINISLNSEFKDDKFSRIYQFVRTSLTNIGKKNQANFDKVINSIKNIVINKGYSEMSITVGNYLIDEIEKNFMIESKDEAFYSLINTLDWE